MPKDTAVPMSNPMPGRVIHVAVPAKIHNDLASMQKVRASLLGRLGCVGCTSGWDIRFDVIRDFVVDEKLNIQESLHGVVIVHG